MKPYLKYVLHAIILIGVVLVAYKYLNGEAVFKALRSFDYTYIPYMLALTTGYMLLKAWRFVLLMGRVTRLPGNVSFRVYLAGQAATLVPGGIAARAGMLKQADVAVGKSTAPVMISSVLDQVVFILGSIIAAFFFEQARTPIMILVGVLIILGLIFALPGTRVRLAKGAQWLTKKLNIYDQWQDFLKALPEVVTWRIMVMTLFITIVAFVLQIINLHFSLRGIGETIPMAALFLSYIVPTMLGRIIPIPGGVGVTEVGMVGFLASTTAIGTEPATAAVAIFRIATVVFQAALGAIVYFLGWRGEKEAPASAS